MTTLEWTDASKNSYTAEETIIGGHTVSVCLDDEAVFVGTYAYYWDIDNRAIDGWAGSVEAARVEAVATAEALEPA